MRKRVNKIDSSFVLSGVGAGEHRNAVEDITDIVCEMGSYVDMFNVRLRSIDYPDELFYEIAELAKDKKYYFAFLYAYQFAPEGKESHLNAKIVKRVKEIAGKYFLGEILGEAGSDKGAKAKGYFKQNPTCMAEVMPPQNFKSMSDAKDYYINYIKKITEYDKSIGIENTMLVEATAFSKYNIEAGVDIPALEMMPGNPEELIAFTRGATVGYDKKAWCGYIANEWYGGYRHEDALKEMRLKIAYRYLYLCGASIIYLESGYNKMCSFGYNFGFDSPECTTYRNIMKDFHYITESVQRPTCGPVTKVAFLHGNLDAYTGFMGSSIWSQFDKPEWGKSTPEYSWNILNEVYRSSDWHDPANFGGNGNDFSNAPAFGQYDVLPVESDVSIMKNYELLIFAGWNTMTEEIYRKLQEYVECGGRLIISAAHLNTIDKRGEGFQCICGGKLSKFLGCDIVGISNTNDGVKFRRDGEWNGVQYPGTNDFICDCNYGNGYADYATVKLTSGKIVAFFEDKFAPAPTDWSNVRPALIENKFGKGVVSFLTHIDYPGNSAVYPLYKVIVKENLTQTHRDCDLKVMCGDKIRFALYYDEDGNEKLFLLNTDYNLSQNIKILYEGRTEELTIHSTELKSIDFKI